MNATTDQGQSRDQGREQGGTVLIDRVAKTYVAHSSAPVLALDEVTTSIASGEFVTLLGPSGCGKTTLLDVIAGLTSPTQGSVLVGGVPVADAPTAPGMVFQNPVLLPWRTALENVLLPAELGPKAPRRPDRAIEADARELLRLVGLGDFTDRLPDELSGGMQQRVAIARALLLHSPVLLMDEPFSALDEFTREQMHLELLRIKDERALTVLFVTHNIFEAVFLADRILVMTPRPGKVVADLTMRLPRARSRDLIGSEAFAAEVRRVRDALTTVWEEEQR
ncbi:ABC transporter ATP-binding protein [Nonomuraea antimicrobica]|uniref:ABC transporter ATP-binding protein n=1 Tax=Nonomuraea antimicrobica TaxID=561173 RepID=A0ABP7E4U5_9ACTN